MCKESSLTYRTYTVDIIKGVRVMLYFVVVCLVLGNFTHILHGCLTGTDQSITTNETTLPDDMGGINHATSNNYNVTKIK